LALEHDEDEDLFYLSMLSVFPGRWSWRQRLRFAWLALRGKLYLDDMVLDRDSICKVGKFILRSRS